MLHRSDGSCFAQGATPLSIRPLRQYNDTERIFIPVRVEGQDTEAILDTGSVYFICDPGIVEFLELDPQAALERVRLSIRRHTYTGDLHRLTVSLVAQQGQSVQLDLTAFVPRLIHGAPWPYSSFLGFQCCLDRLQFAVDPFERVFYFGQETHPENS